MFTPAAGTSVSATRKDISAASVLSPAVAAEIAFEYASLRSPRVCPRGIYITPSPETLLRWYGVFFVHSGPYVNAVLRFIVVFPIDYPDAAPKIQFESEVFHPLIAPKTKIWHPRGDLARWRPRDHHIPHILHDLKRNFDTAALDSITEEQAVNKQIWSLYHYSRHTFLSMTAQRAFASASSRTLFHETADQRPTSPTAIARPTSPHTPRRPTFHGRQESTTSASSGSLRSKASRETLRKAEGEGYIAFRKLEDGERDKLLSQLAKSNG